MIQPTLIFFIVFGVQSIELNPSCLAISKAELCIDFFNYEIDYCMQHLRPYYNKVSTINAQTIDGYNNLFMKCKKEIIKMVDSSTCSPS